MSSLAKRNYLSELTALDWDFSGSRGNDGLAGYHWYPARFVPQVPGLLIGYFTEPGELVLDPFCGSGTTLTEAVRLGRRGIGIDTNPAAVMMSRGKLTPISSTEEWAGYVRAIRLAVEATTVARPEEDLLESVPNEELRDWYDPRTLAELSAIWQSIPDGHPYDRVARVAFSSVLRSACSQDNHWGWVCDNVKPKTMRYKPAREMFFAKLDDFGRKGLGVWEGFRTYAPIPDAGSAVRILEGAASECLRLLPDASVDAVVTSPPYYGTTDYARSQRLSFMWFGWDLDESRYAEAGARFKRHRKNAYEEYLSDMRASFAEVRRVLRDQRHCAVVVGESTSRRAYLEDFHGVLEGVGFEIELILERRLPAQRALARLTHEEIILLKAN